jgi:ATP-dependent helicase/nuclease subunit B
MRQELGLPLPERRIGLAAHDFVQAACASVVYLTRAERAAGAPTVKARWLARLDALLGRGDDAADLSPDLAAGAQWLHWADRLDQPEAVASARPPRPTPPLEARPRQLSVTNIELWRRDPYALYARTVLRLRPLDPIDMDPTARDRGNLIHGVLDEFLGGCGGVVGADAEARLIALGRRRFEQSLDRPAERAFWWPRFERAACWFVATQRERQAQDIALAIAEATGQMSLRGSGGAFVVTAKADRIDRLPDGSLEIIDYKTGAGPSIDQVAAGYAPQLPLEALIARQSGFMRDGLTAQGKAARLSYWRLRGKEEGGEIENVLLKKKLIETMAGYAEPGESVLAILLRLTEQGLIRRIAHYDNPTTPYLSRPRPAFAGFGEYDHLARVKEWAVAYGDD